MASVLVTSPHQADTERPKQNTNSPNRENGRVVPCPGPLVTQGLKTIKLEQDFITIVTTEANFEDNVGGDVCTDEVAATRDDVESLKNAVQQLTLQVTRQNEVITNITSGLRNAALPVLAWCHEDEIEDDFDIGGAVNDGASDPPYRSVSGTPLRGLNGGRQDCLATPQKHDSPRKSLDGSVAKLALAGETGTREFGPHPIGVELEDDKEYATKGDDPYAKSDIVKYKGLMSSGKCRLCNKTFKCPRSIYQHIQTAHRGVRYTCTKCPRKFTQIKALRHHVIRFHTDGGPSTIGRPVSFRSRVRIFLCQHCPQSFSKLMDLRCHTSQVHGIPSVKDADGGLGQNTTSCAMVADPAVATTASAKVSDGSDKDKGQTSQFQCHLCSKIFYSRCSVYFHIKAAHHGVRYKCLQCPGTFIQFSYLQRHITRVHTAGGPPTQKCGICGVHLLQGAGSLRAHMTHRHAKVVRVCASTDQCPR